VFGPVTRCRAEGCEGRGVRHLGRGAIGTSPRRVPKAKVAIKSTSTVVWTRPYQSENEFLSPKHRSQCTTSMQFVSKKPSRFRTERSICVARRSKAKHHEGPSEGARTKLESQFASAFHESIPTKTGQKGTRRKTRKQKLYLSVLVREPCRKIYKTHAATEPIQRTVYCWDTTQLTARRERPSEDISLVRGGSVCAAPLVAECL
jgi:hypothetical protein